MNHSRSIETIGISLFSVLAINSTFFATNTYTLAQIVPDNTLGSESSITLPDPQLPVDMIGGGAVRGVNLFHSFSEFNVGEGRGAYFYSPSSSVENILARVTGGNPSTILGTIGTYGNSIPNLFLINPNGIIFGANASLDIGNSGLNIKRTGGSFVATTANAVILGDTGGVFSASNPAASNLLNVQPSALFFNGVAPAEIINRSTATTTVTGLSINGLQVPNDRSLLLVGGDVTLDKGNIYAAGGQVELAGVTTGTVGLNINDNDLSLSYSSPVQFADVLLTKNSTISVLSSSGGRIAINAQNINILESELIGGISPGGTSLQAQAGDITLNASENIVLTGNKSSTLIFNDVNSGAVGNGGNINIQAESIFLDNALLNAITRGRGNAGNVFIQARNVSLISSNISSDVDAVATGKGGNIDIQAESLFLNNSGISNNNRGAADAGSISIQSNDIVLDKSTISSSNFANLLNLINNTEESSSGKGGDIRIFTNTLALNNGSNINTSTYGLGDAGNVFISATGAVSLAENSNILSAVSGLTPLSLEVPNGEIIDILVPAAIGNGGNINIEAQSLSVSGDSLLITATRGLGDAGNVSIRARGAVTFTDNSGVLSGVLSNDFIGVVGTDAVGNGGNLSIVADSLAVDRSTITTSTTGVGNSGSIFVQAKDIALSNDSRVSSAVQAGGVGNAGDINLVARSLEVTGGSQIRAAVERARDELPGGQGKGGNIAIDASEQVNISGVSADGISSAISTSTDRGARGEAGNIIVNTSNFRIADGAVVSALTANSSNAGSITINAQDFTATSGGQVLTTTNSSGNAGNISLNVASRIDLSAQDPNFATRQAQFGSDVVTNQSASSGLFANTALGSTGSGGSIFVNSQQLNIAESAGVSVDSQGQGNAGNLQVQAQLIALDNRAFLSASTASGEGGNINLQAQDLLLLSRNSNITTAAGGTGNGGNINLDATFIVAPATEDSNIIADAIAGNGGNIKITTQGIFGIAAQNGQTPQSDITASSELGIDGDIAITNPDVNPSQSLATLPVETIDMANQIASGCNGIRQKVATNKFVVTGRGGLPANPGNPLASEAVLTDWATLSATENKSASPNSSLNQKSSAPIVEAQGWIIDNRGRVMLTAQALQTTPNSSKLTTTCNGS
jgi:filamentous hemagglutinin family protein